MSGGGAQMATKFSGLLAVSKQYIWIDCFTKVEEIIGKAQIRLGHKIISKKLEEEVALSELDAVLNHAKVTLLMDGGWDQRASGNKPTVVCPEGTCQ
jgi:hypothetical protein